MNKQADKPLFQSFKARTKQDWETVALESLKGRPLHSLNRKRTAGIVTEAMLFKSDVAGQAELGRIRDGKGLHGGCPPLQELSLDELSDSRFASLKEIGQTQIPIQLGAAPVASLQQTCKKLELLELRPVWRCAENWQTALEQVQDVDGSLEVDLLSPAVTEGRSGVMQEVAQDLAPALEKGHLKLAIRSWSFHSAGAGARLELAIWLASFAEHMRLLERAGCSLDNHADVLVHELAVGHELFPEMAKLRAARLLAARFLECLDVPADSRAICLYGRGSLKSSTALDPWNNLLRSTLQGMAASCAGLDGLHLQAPREGFAQSTEMEDRIRENVHLILKGESGLDLVSDPGRGSHLVEDLSWKLATEAWKQFSEIESNGGLLACLKDGSLQGLVQVERQAAETAFATRKQVLVGVNQYADPNAELRENPDTGAVKADTLALPSFRLAGRLESLRFQFQQQAKRLEQSAAICLLGDGALKLHKARMDFSRDFLASSGLELLEAGSGLDLKAAARAACDTNARIFVLCSSDERYPEWVPAILQEIDHLDRNRKDCCFVLAGNPVEHMAALKKAGIQYSLHVKADQQALLEALHAHLEKLS